MSEQPHSTDPLYAVAECELVDMKNGGLLLIDKYGPGQLLVAPNVAQTMTLCREFRTLEEHVAVLTASTPELKDRPQEVMAVLNMFRDAGLLVTAESACSRLNAEVNAPVDLPPTRVFIITCDRPASVERLLESMLHSAELARHEGIFLIDDSREPANAQANREAAAKFNLTSPRNMQYVGAVEQKLFMDNLIAGLPEQEDGIRFLVDRDRWTDEKTYGLARNFCLLLSVGCRAIVMDDDVVCAAIESPHKRAGLQFGELPREVDFYTSRADILSRTTRADFDPLTGHASCLGLNIGQAMARLSGEPIDPTQLHHASSAYLSQWDATSHVIVTQSGTLGDPGSPKTAWIYTLDPASCQRLENYPGGLEGALTNRHYWMGQPRPMFTKMSVISQVTGLDNSQLLPPYFPVFRGEDYLFGAMTEYLHPQAAVLEYDWCVPHFPLDERMGDPAPDSVDGKGMININKYITDRTVYRTGISPEARLESLTAMIKELSMSSDLALTTLFRAEVAENQCTEFVRLRNYAQDGKIRTPAWQDWLQRSVSGINQSMQEPARLTDISSLPSAMTAEAVLGYFHDYAAKFAGALGGWTSIRDGALLASARLLDSGDFAP